MGTGDSKSQSRDCKAIEDDDNFDLQGCLESLSDMAYTGKNTPLRRSTATSRALWSMSRALSAPVTASDKSSRRPSLTRSKAVSLDSCGESYGACGGRLSAPLSVVEENDNFNLSINNSNESFNQKHRASPSIEVIPPDGDQPSECYVSDPKLSFHRHEQGTYVSQDLQSKRLKFPATADKHSILLEKRKKTLTKGKRVDEETSLEGFGSSKRHSATQDKVPDWEQIQEWMVWCIHENLDDDTEDELFGGSSSLPPSRSSMYRGPPIHQSSSPGGVRKSLQKVQNQLTDMHLSYHSSDAVSSSQIHLQHRDRHLHLDGNYRLPISPKYGGAGKRSPTNQKSGIHLKSTPVVESHTKRKSPIIKRVFQRESSQGKTKPKHRNVLSLDSHLFKMSGQSSFESSGSSRMNSFDSTGTHNDKL